MLFPLKVGLNSLYDQICYLFIRLILFYIIDKANKELVEVARRTEPSGLRQRSYEGMATDSWMSDVKNELSTRCPVVNNIMSVLLDTEYKSEKKEPALCLIHGIIMYLRCHELSRIQRINSILLTHGQASVNVSLINNCICF